MDLVGPLVWCGWQCGELLVCVLHQEQLQEDLLPLGKDRLDASHYASLVGMHMYEQRMLGHVCVHVHSRRCRETSALSCLQELMIMDSERTGWSLQLGQL